jgi:hypothetical protein
MRGRQASTERWLNACDTSPRSRLWSGSSSRSMDGWKASGGTSPIIARRRGVSGALRGSTDSDRSARTALISSKRVRNSRPSAASKWTGSSARQPVEVIVRMLTEDRVERGQLQAGRQGLLVRHRRSLPCPCILTAS